MSVATAPGSTVAPASPPGGRKLPPIALVLGSLTVLLVTFASIRVITGADSLTDPGTLSRALVLAIPIALAGLGGLWSERAGVVNIGLEGMMILGTLGAGYYTYHFGVWVGLLGAIAFGAVGGVLHAVATVIFGVDHIVSGVAITIIAGGVAAFLAEVFFSDLEGGGPTQSPGLKKPMSFTLPGISDASGDLADNGWFLISDLAAVVNAVTTKMSVFTLLALVVILGSGWLLWHTAFGLRLRSCGESPSSAETLGVNVYRYKFIAVTISGALAGFAGCYLAVVASSGYSNGQTNGRGYIGLAAMIFGNWRPGGLLTGSLLFGYTDAARLRQGGESVHALLLLIGIALIGYAGWQFVKARRLAAMICAVIGVSAIVTYLLTDTITDEFTEMTPYLTTLLVLALASQRLRMPAADGLRYRRGQAG